MGKARSLNKRIGKVIYPKRNEKQNKAQQYRYLQRLNNSNKQKKVWKLRNLRKQILEYGKTIGIKIEI